MDPDNKQEPELVKIYHSVVLLLMQLIYLVFNLMTYSSTKVSDFVTTSI